MDLGVLLLYEPLRAKHLVSTAECGMVTGMENWKAVVGYEGLYEVSDHGRVRSATTGKIKAQCANKVDGRPFLALWIANKCKIFKPHTLVLTAFVAPRPEGMECCHNDGHPWNNHVSNLRWDTCKNNHADKVLHGTTNRGERCGTHKLTQAQVDAIRKDTRLQRLIAADYGVRDSAISRIKSRKLWAHS